MISNTFDSTLVWAYKEFDVPVDRFLADDHLTRKFVATVAGKLDQAVESQQVMRRLMNLRKKGRLPRLRRAYHGRHAR
jgi:hypothetical protein